MLPCFGTPADLFRGPHGVEDARYDLCRPSAARVVGRSALEEFGVGENDTELVVQAMEQRSEFGIHVGGADALGSRSGSIGSRGREVLAVHACCPAVTGPAGVCRGVSPGSRQSVSAKIRIDPPAVRTYSTLPAEIQL